MYIVLMSLSVVIIHQQKKIEKKVDESNRLLTKIERLITIMEQKK